MKILVIVSFLISFQSIAQTKDEAREILMQIHDKSDIDSMRTVIPDWFIFNITVSPFGYKVDSFVIHSPIGSIHEISYGSEDEHLYKVLSKGKREYCKVSFIQLKSNNLTKKEIINLQDQIIQEYETGKTIEELALKYSKAPNSTGEYQWFDKKSMSADFVNAVWNEPINSVIKVDLPRFRYHYVVFKTHSNIEVDVAHCARIKICPTGCRELHHISEEIRQAKVIKKASEFPGGEEALNKFISEEIIYPREAIKNNEEGTVEVSFVIEADGSLTNIKVKKGVTDLLNEEALRLVKLMPNWTPTISHDRVVRGVSSVEIVFELK